MVGQEVLLPLHHGFEQPRYGSGRKRQSKAAMLVCSAGGGAATPITASSTTQCRPRKRRVWGTRAKPLAAYCRRLCCEPARYASTIWEVSPLAAHNLAGPLPAQKKICCAKRQCGEASRYKRLSHRRDQNGRERHVQADEQHLCLLQAHQLQRPCAPRPRLVRGHPTRGTRYRRLSF